MGLDGWSDPTRLVPPYAITGGRAWPVLAPEDLELESLVSTTSLGETSAPTLTPEQRGIVLLCRDVLSIAEVSAHLDVPIGVARVLVGTWPRRAWSRCTARPAPASVPASRCWSGCCTACGRCKG
jgi:hypothetical protein